MESGISKLQRAVLNIEEGDISKLQESTSQQNILQRQQGEINVLRKDTTLLQSTIKLHQGVLDSQGKPKVFVLSQFRKRKEAAEQFQFPPFYTHYNGYCMALRVDANGLENGLGTHVSVFAPILKGEHDAELKWPLVGNVTFTLLNQLKDKNHHSLPLSLDSWDVLVGSAWGRAQFIHQSALSHDPVKNTQYLKDDTLYFRMSVEVADYELKPWLMN
jgi:TNF receptor-associated factor 4